MRLQMRTCRERPRMLTEVMRADLHSCAFPARLDHQPVPWPQIAGLMWRCSTESCDGEVPRGWRQGSWPRHSDRSEHLGARHAPSPQH